MSKRDWLGAAAVVALLTWPLLPNMPYDLVTTAILACQYLIIAVSLVLLIGYVGQISLAQASLVGVGAFVSAVATLNFGVRFPLTLLVGSAAGALAAMVIGAVALRVRGLYLAVATLIFAYICDRYLFSQPWLVPSQSGTAIPFESIGVQGSIPYFDLGDAHVVYFFALAVAALALYATANLRDSKLGRAFGAIRGSEVAAASLGINVARVKLQAFALSGALAGLAGALTLSAQRTVAPYQFDFITSLFFLGVVVVGGSRSLGGAVASSLLFAGLVGEVFFHFTKLADYRGLISAVLLIAVLLFFRGGLGALPDRLGQLVRPASGALERLRLRLVTATSRRGGATGAPEARQVRRSLSSRLPGLIHRSPGADSLAQTPIDVAGLTQMLNSAAANHSTPPAAPDGSGVIAENRGTPSVRDLLSRSGEAVAGAPTPAGRRQPVLLSAEGITVRFGGLTAVSDAWLRVGAGEIVGLIGPNGAGKTTLFNAVLGLNSPAAGSVKLFGRDVSRWPVHARSALGVGRTFQVLQLFPELTVFDNLLVGTHLQNPTGLLGGIAVSPSAMRAEQAARQRVDSVLQIMELEQFRDRRVANLPFGVLRLVEVARTLVTGARLVCFDEPASGLDTAETERLIEWLRLLRQIGVTLLVIEHDVDMVTRLCDYIYVLDQGHLIAQGTPAEIHRNPAVIASYLGTAMEVA